MSTTRTAVVNKCTKATGVYHKHAHNSIVRPSEKFDKGGHSFFEARWRDPAWEHQSPKLIVRQKSAALHFPQVKHVEAKRVKESKEDPHLVTVGVDLNVKNLAVVTVRQDERIIETVFLTDHGLDQARYRHLKKIARKQWQTGKPIKGEHSNQQLWRHVRRTNEVSLV